MRGASPGQSCECKLIRDYLGKRGAKLSGVKDLHLELLRGWCLPSGGGYLVQALSGRIYYDVRRASAAIMKFLRSASGSETLLNGALCTPVPEITTEPKLINTSST